MCVWLWEKDCFCYGNQAKMSRAMLTMSDNITPAARMNTVWENCWMIRPQMKPTAPNNVIIMRDSVSALPWPSKSWPTNRNLQFKLLLHTQAKLNTFMSTASSWQSEISIKTITAENTNNKLEWISVHLPCELETCRPIPFLFDFFYWNLFI